MAQILLSQRIFTLNNRRAVRLGDVALLRSVKSSFYRQYKLHFLCEMKPRFGLLLPLRHDSFLLQVSSSEEA